MIKYIFECKLCGYKTKMSADAAAMMSYFIVSNLCRCQIKALPDEGKISDLPESSLEKVGEVWEEDNED